jgi:hypothetical protein
MPRRSNSFQRLVFLIQHQLAAGARVTESKFLPDKRPDGPWKLTLSSKVRLVA